MIKLDAEFLASVGLADLPRDLHSKMLNHIYDMLQVMVGQEITAALSSSQIAEFNAVYARGGDAATLQWLESARPDYKDVVDRNADSLKQAIRSVAERILLDEGIAPSDGGLNSASAAATIDNDAVRAWAAEKGLRVARFGRIPQKVIDAYARRSRTDG